MLQLAVLKIFARRDVLRDAQAEAVPFCVTNDSA